MERNNSADCYNNCTNADEGSGDSTKKERSKSAARTSVITRATKKERMKDTHLSPRVSTSAGTCVKNRDVHNLCEENAVIRDDDSHQTEKSRSVLPNSEQYPTLQRDSSSEVEEKSCGQEEAKEGRRVERTRERDDGGTRGGTEVKAEDEEADQEGTEDQRMFPPDNKPRPSSSAGLVSNTPPMRPSPGLAAAGNTVIMVGTSSEPSPIHPETRNASVVSTTEDVVCLSRPANCAAQSQNAVAELGDRTKIAAFSDVCCVDNNIDSTHTDVCCLETSMRSVDGRNQTTDINVEKADSTQTADNREFTNSAMEISYKAKEAEAEMRRRMALNRIILESRRMEVVDEGGFSYPRSMTYARYNQCGGIPRSQDDNLPTWVQQPKECSGVKTAQDNLPTWVQQPKECSGVKTGQDNLPTWVQQPKECSGVKTGQDNLPTWVQQPKECSGLKTGQEAIPMMQTQAADCADTADCAVTVDNAMLAGEAKGGDSKLFYVLDSEDTCKALDADVPKVSEPGVAPSAEAGDGDAATDADPQACGGRDSGSAHIAQAVKREPVESTNKSIRDKMGRSFEIDPSLIPIKAIPALNVVPASQPKPKALDSVEAIPYIPPDTSMMYQPEEGVLKSRPVPRPTRGRRGRRRGSVSLTSAFRHCSPGLHPHHDLRTLCEPRRVLRHPYHRYNLPDTAPLPLHYCNVEAGPGGEFDVVHPDAAGDMMGVYSDLSSLNSISPHYPNSRWYCGEDCLKAPSQWYAGSGGRGGRRGGRGRGRRGSGGVRQYLQHRLLWARYTGRSQEALDRVLTIINSKCSLKEDVAKETPTKTWSGDVAMEDVEDEEVFHGERLHDPADPACPDPEDPYNYYNNRNFSSNISNMMSEGSGNGGSILSQSGMGSNAVVDGNGYIVYLNREDSTDFHSPAIPFVPPDNTLSNTDEPGAPGVAVTTKSNFRGSEMMKEGVGLPGQMCSEDEAVCLFPEKLVIDGVPLNAQTEVGETSKTGAMEPDDCTPTEDSRYPEQQNSKPVSGRKRATPRRLKTPVSPVKGQKAAKRSAQTSGGKQKKRVRRSLTFSSPIKQEDGLRLYHERLYQRTLTATESIANAMTNSSETEMGSSTEDVASSAPTPLPSISSLLQSAANTGISINIHVTNDANGERSVRAGSDEVSADRGRNSMEPAGSQGAMTRAEMGHGPVEVTAPVHFPVPRYTVEWHSDFQGPDMTDRSHRYQHHPQATLPSTGSTVRYPYRDPSSSLGYYAHERLYHAPAATLDRYYTAGDWPGAYAKYPPEHYLPGYEQLHEALPGAYPAAQPMAGWDRSSEVYVDPYQEASSSSRVGPGVAPRDPPYSYYHRAPPYPAPSGFPEEAYLHPRTHYTNFGTAAAFADRYAKQKLGSVPDGGGVGRCRPSEACRQDPACRLYRPWVATGSVQTQPGMEGRGAALGPQLDPSSQLRPPADDAGCGAEDVGPVEPAREVNQLNAEHHAQL